MRVQKPVAGEAIRAMQTQIEQKERVRHNLSPRAHLHIGPIQESHVLANGMNYSFAQFVRCAETAQ